jgi:hypothetical protein
MPLALAQYSYPDPDDAPTIRQIPSTYQSTPAPVKSNQESFTRTPLRSDFSSQRLPAGTLLKVSFQSLLDARLTQLGEPVIATMVEDLAGLRGQILIPRGSVLRGRVDQVTRPSYFGEAGVLSVQFDHVVLPSGLQQPLDLRVSPHNVGVTPNGDFQVDPGLGAKLGAAVVDGGDVITNFSRKGVNAGKGIASGAAQIVTIPAAVLIGSVLAGGLIVGKSAKALIGKGDNVAVQPTDVLVLELLRDTTLQVAD